MIHISEVPDVVLESEDTVVFVRAATVWSLSTKRACLSSEREWFNAFENGVFERAYTRLINEVYGKILEGITIS